MVKTVVEFGEREQIKDHFSVSTAIYSNCWIFVEQER